MRALIAELERDKVSDEELGVKIPGITVEIDEEAGKVRVYQELIDI